MNNNSVSAALFCLVLFSAVPSLPVLGSSAPGFEGKTGTIKGRVLDEDVRSPVAYASIVIRGTAFRAVTDAQGNFTIEGVPVGSYVLEIGCRFYRTRLLADVVVKSQRFTQVEIPLALDLDVQEHEEVTVTAGYYSESRQKTASLASFSQEEIRRAAGSAGDVSRIVSGLPSIARVNDQVNALVVRGGSPVENAFYIDNIAVPNINHYPIQGSSGGALALLNVDFIQDVRFYSGGFAPRFGNRLSSVMDVSFREGNRERYDFQLDFSMAGFGMITEGPLPGGNGSWMLSGRRSYLDLIDRYFDVGVAPSWGDIQGKVTYDLSSRGKLTLLGIWGDDRSGWGREKSLELGDTNYGFHNALNSALGINWFHTWGENGYSNTSLSRSHIDYKINFSDTGTDRLLVRNHSGEETFTLRNVNVFRLSGAYAINLGLEFQYLRMRTDYALGAGTDVLGHPYTAFHIESSRESGRYAGFVNLSWIPIRRVSLNLGARVDHSSLSRSTLVSPRASLSVGLTPRTALNAAVGIFTQGLPGLLLMQSEAFRGLREPRAAHYVLGFSHLLTEDTRLTVESYYKDYRRMPLDPTQPVLFVLDEIYTQGFYSHHKTLADSGQAKSYGIEAMVQKKLADKLYGLVSASFFRAYYRDLFGVWRPRVYDNRFIIAVEGGYRPGRSWELSAKWQYAGGVPYTPFDTEASTAANSGVYEFSRIHGDRLKSYHSLNLRVDKRFHFGGSNLILFFSVWNVYNRRNVAYLFWNTLENRPDFENQWGLLPILGLEFEF